MTPTEATVMYNQSNIEKQYEISGSKLAADTMVYRITSLGLSVLGMLWTLGKNQENRSIQSHS